MKREELKKLLEKYYNGDSTDEDEKILRGYFTDIANPAEPWEESEIFRYFEAAGVIAEPAEGFENRILAGIDAFDYKAVTPKKKRFILQVISVAAGLLILAGSYFFLFSQENVKDTFSDPELAYAETMKILFDVSTRLNNGTRALEPIDKLNDMTIKSFKAIKHSTIIIEKNIKNLDYLISPTDSSVLSIEDYK